MRTNPGTDEELDGSLVWPKGVYDFEVVSALDRVSKSGNEMIELQMKCYNDEGETNYVFDYLVDSEKGLCRKKIKRFCQSTGMLDRYESDSLNGVDCEGASGRVRLIKEKRDDYPERNVVDSLSGGYVPAEQEIVEEKPAKGAKGTKTKKQTTTSSVADDAEIPF